MAESPEADPAADDPAPIPGRSSDERHRPGRARRRRRRPDADDRRGAGRDGLGHGRRGDAGPAGGAPRRPADARRDDRRAGRLRRRDARPRRPGRGARPARSTWSGPAATAAARSTSRPPRRSSWPRPGIPVAKHGNRAITSRSGSADVLDALGVRIDHDAASAAEALRDLGFAFLFAPNFHPAMRHAGPTRREIGVRTSFNLLGPLTNPAGATRQVLGVGDAAAAPRLAEVAQRARHGTDARRPRRRRRRAAARRQRRRARRHARRRSMPDGRSTRARVARADAEHERGPGRRRRPRRTPASSRPSSAVHRARIATSCCSMPPRRSSPPAGCPTSRPGSPPRGPRSTPAERPALLGRLRAERIASDAARPPPKPAAAAEAAPAGPRDRRSTGVTSRSGSGHHRTTPSRGPTAASSPRSPRAGSPTSSPSSRAVGRARARSGGRRGARRRATSPSGSPDPASTSSPRSSGGRRRPARSRRPDDDPVARARAYERGGASAISVLCEPHWFGGSIGRPARRSARRSACRSWPRSSSSTPASCPLLRAAGADAGPAPGRPPPGPPAERASSTPRSTSGSSRSSRPTTPASSTGRSRTRARVIGINNRDLRTLDVDPERAVRLRGLVPDDRLAVAESGVREPATVAGWRAVGFDAALVGEALDAGGRPGRGGARVRRRRARSRTIPRSPTDCRSSRSAASSTRPAIARRHARRCRCDRPEPGRPGRRARSSLDEAAALARLVRAAARGRGAAADRGRHRRRRCRAGCGRSSRRSTRTSSSSTADETPGVRRSARPADLEGPPPAGRGADRPRRGRRGDRRARPRLPGRRASSDSCSTRPADRIPGGTGTRSAAPLAAAVARELPVVLAGGLVAGERRPGASSRSRRSASTSPRASRPRGSPASGRARTRSASPCSPSGPARRASIGPTSPARPTPVHPGLLEADAAGRWGVDREFGGRYVPETLMAALEGLERAYAEIRHDPRFWAEFRELPRDLLRPARRRSTGPTAWPPRRWPTARDCLGGGAEALDRLPSTLRALPQARGPRPHRRPQDQQRARPGAADPAARQDAGHRRDRGRPARRRDRHGLRAARPAVRRVHGRRGHPPPGAERAPDARARDRGPPGHERLGDAQGRGQRGDARLGHERRDDPLRPRLGDGTASLSDDRPRPPARHRRRGRGPAGGGRGPAARPRPRLRRRRVERDRAPRPVHRRADRPAGRRRGGRRRDRHRPPRGGAGRRARRASSTAAAR